MISNLGPSDLKPTNQVNMKALPFSLLQCQCKCGFIQEYPRTKCEKNNSQATTELTNKAKKSSSGVCCHYSEYKNTLVNIHPHPKVHYLHYITRKITYFIFYLFVCNLFTWTNVWMLSSTERYNQQLQNSCELIPQATVCIKVNVLFLSLTSLDCFSK